jgi:hypothetical protein
VRKAGCGGDPPTRPGTAAGAKHTMAEIINLNQFRKQRGRKEDRKTAAENRVRHGRAKIERRQQQAEQETRRRDLDGHKLDEKNNDGKEPA